MAATQNGDKGDIMDIKIGYWIIIQSSNRIMHWM